MWEGRGSVRITFITHTNMKMTGSVARISEVAQYKPHRTRKCKDVHDDGVGNKKGNMVQS